MRATIEPAVSDRYAATRLVLRLRCGKSDGTKVPQLKALIKSISLARGVTAAQRPVKARGLGSNPSGSAMEKIEGFSVERDGRRVELIFSDRFGESETLKFSVTEICQIVGAISQVVPEAFT